MNGGDQGRDGSDEAAPYSPCSESRGTKECAHASVAPIVLAGIFSLGMAKVTTPHTANDDSLCEGGTTATALGNAHFFLHEYVRGRYDVA